MTCGCSKSEKASACIRGFFYFEGLWSAEAQLRFGFFEERSTVAVEKSKAELSLALQRKNRTPKALLEQV